MTASSGAGGTSSARSRRADVTGIDDGAAHSMCAGQKLCDYFDRLLRCRESDPRQRAAGQSLQAFQRQRQMRAAFVARDGVNFIDDDGAAGCEHIAAGLRTQQDVQRLRGGHDDVRRPAPHAGALRLRGVAGAHHRPYLNVRYAKRHQLFANAAQRRLEIALDVVRQRLQRRDVDHARLVRQRSLRVLP